MRGGTILPLPQPLSLPNYDPNSVFVLFLDLDPALLIQGPCMRGGTTLPLPQPLTLPNYDPNSVFVHFLDLDPALLIQEPCMRGGTIGAPS